MPQTLDPDYFVAWRKRQGLTQAVLAEKWGLNVSALKKWETKARKFPPYIGYLMAAVEADLEPIGREAMIDTPD